MPAREIKVNGKLLEDGVTYYARSKTSYLDFDGKSHTTPYGPIISFIYKANAAVKGDVDDNGEVNIADVNVIIDLILTGRYSDRADVDDNGELNIADINELISYILNL